MRLSGLLGLTCMAITACGSSSSPTPSSSTPGQDHNAAACAAYQIEQPKFSDPKLGDMTPHGPAATFYSSESSQLQQVARVAAPPLQAQLQQLAKMYKDLADAINRDDLPAVAGLAGNSAGVVSNIDSTCKSYGH